MHYLEASINFNPIEFDGIKIRNPQGKGLNFLLFSLHFQSDNPVI